MHPRPPAVQVHIPRSVQRKAFHTDLASAKRRIAAEIGDRLIAGAVHAEPGRIDASRRQQRFRQIHICRGKPQTSAAPVATDDVSVAEMETPKHTRGHVHATLLHKVTDPAGADNAPLFHHRRELFHGVAVGAPQSLENGRLPRAPLAQREVVADDQPAHGKGCQIPLEKFLG